MTTDVSPARSSVVPMLAYEDGPAALDWLVRAFGFEETVRLLDDSGHLMHGELKTPEGDVIMLATPTPHYESPRHHREHCEQSRRWQQAQWVIDGVLVYVDSIDDHFARARQAGAVMLSAIEEGFPGRRYRAEDCEGHRWMFMQR